MDQKFAIYRIFKGVFDAGKGEAIDQVRLIEAIEALPPQLREQLSEAVYTLTMLPQSRESREQMLTLSALIGD